jgi:hypothetical protein
MPTDPYAYWTPLREEIRQAVTAAVGAMLEEAMPGKQVKDWDKYHALREDGKSKESAARITNATSGKKKGKKK